MKAVEEVTVANGWSKIWSRGNQGRYAFDYDHVPPQLEMEKAFVR